MKEITMTESYMISPWKCHNKFSWILYKPKQKIEPNSEELKRSVCIEESTKTKPKL